MPTPDLLIADSSDEFRTALSDILQNQFQIRSCKTGREALSCALKKPPQVLLLDLMLPELDGFSLLSALHEANIFPAVIAVTQLISDYIICRITQLKVSYLLVKPCDIASAAQRVLEIGRSQSTEIGRVDPRKRVGNALLDLGVSAKLKGYQYLLESILMMLDDPDLSITKELYPAVGTLCKTSGMLVERSIRSAVDSAWRRRDERGVAEVFPSGQHGNHCPSFQHRLHQRRCQSLPRKDPLSGVISKSSGCQERAANSARLF